MSFINPKQNLLDNTFDCQKVGQSNGKEKQNREKSSKLPKFIPEYQMRHLTYVS